MDSSIVSAGLFMEMDAAMANRHMTNEEAAECFLADGLNADRDFLMEVLAAVDHHTRANSRRIIRNCVS